MAEMLWPKSGKPIPNPSLILGNENGMDFECSIRSQLLACSCAEFYFMNSVLRFVADR